MLIDALQSAPFSWNCGWANTNPEASINWNFHTSAILWDAKMFDAFDVFECQKSWAAFGREDVGCACEHLKVFERLAPLVPPLPLPILPTPDPFADPHPDEILWVEDCGDFDSSPALFFLCGSMIGDDIRRYNGQRRRASLARRCRLYRTSDSRGCGPIVRLPAVIFAACRRCGYPGLNA